MFATRRTTPSRRLFQGAAALLTAAGLALAGCSADQSGGNGVSGAIRVSALTAQPYLQDAVNGFKKHHPGVTVQMVAAPSNTYQTTIRAQLAAKHGPDVMFVWGGSGNSMATKILAKAGELKDLSGRPWVSSIGTVANSLVTYDGKVYALNSYENPTGVVYNTALLRKLGVSVPTTFSGLLGFCRTVHGRGIVPIALGNQTGYLNTEVPLELANTLVYAQDPKFAQHLADGSVKWSTSALWKDSLTKALTEYLQMNSAHCFESDSTGYSDTQANAMVAAGKALGVDVISPAIADLRKDDPSKTYDMFSLPATDNPGDTVLTVNTGAAYGVSATTSNPKTALALVDYMAQPAQLAAASKANYGLPYTPSPSTAVDRTFTSVKQQYLGGKVALWQTNFWPGYQVKQTMIAECQNLILGKQSVSGVVDAVQKSLGNA